VNIVVSDDDIVHVARHLHGSAGLGGTESMTLSSWLLGYKNASSQLRVALAHMAEWMANGLVPWAAIPCSYEQSAYCSRQMSWGLPH
jgi:hypothetical protein